VHKTLAIAYAAKKTKFSAIGRGNSKWFLLGSSLFPLRVVNTAYSMRIFAVLESQQPSPQQVME
jgi:hypothetical protein